MKKKYTIFTLLLAFILMPSIVNAEDYINSNGITITEEQYNNYLNLYSEEYIDVMTEEDIQKYKLLKYRYMFKDI